MYDDISEIFCTKKITSIYNYDEFRDFCLPCHIKEEFIQTFQQKIMLLDKNGPTYEARKQYHNDKMKEKLDAIDSFQKVNNKRKRKLHHIDEKIENCLDPRKQK